MATSTLSKLYGYLRGYETSAYTGAPKSEVANSIFELLADELEILFPESEWETERKRIISEITKYVDSYLTKFYSRMKKLKTSLIVKEVADKAKDDSSNLSHLMSILIQGESTPMDCLGVGIMSSNTVSSVCDICDGCPYYLKSRFCVIYQNSSDDEEDAELIGELFQFKLPETRSLALAMLKMAHHLITTLGVNLNKLTTYYMLFNHILVCSKIYELMNPTGEARQNQINEAKALLTSPPLDRNTDKYQNYLSILHSVFNDIKEGKKAYIKAIRRALDRNSDLINSKYDEEKDAYFSLKGTGQSLYTGIHESIVSSGEEVDYYRDLFQEFDSFVGFKSYYKEKGDLDITNDKIYCIRTIMINNPGKFKGRIIHIFDNPIQDRANFIQRRTKAILTSLSNDSMIEQDKGRQFLRLKTLEWAAEQNAAQRIGIYNFDFSNATDTLDQHFQWEVLNFIFGPEVANFWDQVSKLPKYIQNVDGSYERYDQSCGQPQGGLSSFNDFSLAHHFIFLMDMKILGFEHHTADEFYTILGDDSSCNSIEPEIDYYDPNDLQYDAEGIPRSSIELLHMDICTHFAGFKVNYSKSESTHFDSFEAKLDFAKVTYRNGQFFSPIPFRLAMNYSSSYDAKLAVAIWRGERGEVNATKSMDLILRNINNTTVTAIVKCGLLPYLEPFADRGIEYNNAWMARLRYCSTIAHLNMMLACLCIADHKRDWATIDTFDQALKTLFSPRQFEMVKNLNSNHKIIRVIDRNLDIIELLKNVYSFEDQDDQLLALLMSPLSAEFTENDEFVDQLINLSRTSRILKLASKDSSVDIATVFPDFDSNYTLQMRRFANTFMTRGIAKKPREEVVLFRSILREMNQLDDILGYLYPNV